MRPNRPPLDDDSAARMLQGLVQPDDAPPGYGAVAGLLAAAARPGPVDEDIASATVTAMVEAIRDGAPAPQTSARKSVLTKLLAGKAALAALGVVALTASGAAAATGSLPSPVQSAVSGAASHVGVNLPSPNHGNSAGHRQDVNHRPGAGDTTPTSAGSQPDNHGQTVSSTAHSTPAGDGHGAAVCQVASAGKCQAGDDHGGGSSGGGGTDAGQDHATTPTTGSVQTGDDQGKGPSAGDDGTGAGQDHATTPTTGSVQTGEDHHNDHAATPTTGSVQTGEEHSGREGGPSGGSGDH